MTCWAFCPNSPKLIIQAKHSISFAFDYNEVVFVSRLLYSVSWLTLMISTDTLIYSNLAFVNVVSAICAFLEIPVLKMSIKRQIYKVMRTKNDLFTPGSSHCSWSYHDNVIQCCLWPYAQETSNSAIETTAAVQVMGTQGGRLSRMCVYQQQECVAVKTCGDLCPPAKVRGSGGG